MSVKIRLIIMNFLEFAVWGAYLTSMGRYLGNIGLGESVGWFYSVQGIVSIFMPAIMGIIADRWINAEKLLGICHAMAAILMLGASYYGYINNPNVPFAGIFTLYTLSVAFFMPTIALANSVAYSVLEQSGLDTIKHFPPIRVFGTIGFICAMWLVDLAGLQDTEWQFTVSAVFGILLAIYSFTLPKCPLATSKKSDTLFEALGLKAFKLFADKRMAIFFIFSMLLGVSLQITNGYANPFIASFTPIKEYADTFGVNHANILVSLSQVSETLCILLIPFFLKRYGIKKVMLIAMVAWVLRFGLFGCGNPGSGVWLFILSMIVYGVAFDFFNVSGSLFVNQETDKHMRSSAQGLFMLMTNGVGATVGTLGAQTIINIFTDPQPYKGQTYLVGDWQSVWYIFAGYALVVAILFALIFKYKHTPEKGEQK